MGGHFGTRPSAFYAIPPDDPMALDFDCTVFDFGQWFDGKRHETKRQKAPAPDGKIDVPMYTPKQLGAFLGLTPIAAFARPAPPGMTPELEAWLAGLGEDDDADVDA